MPSPSDFTRELTGLWRPLPETSGALETEVRRAQQMHLSMHLPAIAVISALNSSVVASVLAASGKVWIAAAWWLVTLSIAGNWWVVARRHAGRELPRRVSGRYMRRAEVTSSLFGTLWGALPFLYVVPGEGSVMFISLMQVTMAAGLVAMVAPVPRITMRFCLLCLLPMSLHYAMSGTLMDGLIGALALIFLMSMYIGSRLGHSQLARMLERAETTRMAEDRLSNAIEATRDAFAIFNDRGELVLANRRYREWFPDGGALPDATSSQDLVRVDDRWFLRSIEPMESGGAVVVHADISALKRREQELIVARREAEEADRAKGRFLSSMSQELRTPLRLIIGLATLMGERSRQALTREEVSQYAGSIQTNADHVLRLISDIIDYSKLGLDKLLIDPGPVDLPALINEAVALARGFESAPEEARIDIEIDPALGPVTADETAIKRILINMVSNALRFGGPAPRVEIRAGLTPSGAPEVSVRDFGDGLTEQEVERAFDAFYQGHRGPGSGLRGTGLGLTLSRSLARLHDGDVAMKSAPGKGTTVTLTLPARCHGAVANDTGTGDPSRRVA